MDPLAYPSRGGIRGEPGRDPLRGQGHRVHLSLDGIIPYEVREFDHLSITADVANAMSMLLRTGGRGGILEQVQPPFGQQFPGQGVGFRLRDGDARGDPVHDRPGRRATVDPVQFQGPEGPYRAAPRREQHRCCRSQGV
ncbi:MAG: hypothetical protein M3325_02870 [Actinomycetota bacterium]|nr:hypothetical protein [Actinomycetota bacterium]